MDTVIGYVCFAILNTPALENHQNPTMAPPDARYATTLAHGLDVLEAFADGPRVLSNAELARRTGLSKATITRLTLTLATRGLVENEAGGRGHRLGTTALTLGYPLLAPLRLRRLARLPMKQLADSLNASVSLGMRERSRMVYVETLRSNDPATFQPDLGAPLPMLQTAMGRAWLAAAAPAEREDVLSSLRASTPELYQRWISALAAASQQLASHGLCISRGDWLADVHAIAVPLQMNLQGERLILNCGLAARRLPEEALQKHIGPQLLKLAAHIEAEWSRALKHSEADSRQAGRVTPAPRRPPLAARCTPPDPADRSFARTLAHGVDLLQCFHPGDESVGNRDISRRLGLSPSTVVRLTHTLCQRGYLRQDTVDGKYRLGAATLATAYPMLSSMRIRRIARPLMLAMAERLGAAVSLGLRHRNSMIYVETAWRTDERLLPPDTGAALPMLLTAMGRAWLARAGPEERQEVLHRLRLEQPQAFAEFHRSAIQAVQFCKLNGWCSSSDFHPELVAVAVPFLLPIDGVRYVMNCGVLKPSAPTQQHLVRIAAELREVVAQAQHEMGFPQFSGRFS